MYSLSEIDKVDVTEWRFERRPFSLAEYASRSFGVFRSDEGPHHVVWKFDNDVADDARQYFFHPTQVFEDQTDGGVIVRFQADGLTEMAWHLFTWGRHVQVVEPDELARLYRTMIGDAKNAVARLARRQPRKSPRR